MKNLQELNSLFAAEKLLIGSNVLPSLPWNDFTSNDQRVKSGGIFVAIKGQNFDGHSKIDEVLEKKPAAIFSEVPHSSPHVIHVTDTRRVLGFLAAAHSDFPTRTLKVFGVTGTSGKTTTTFILEALLKEAGHKVGLIGTVEIRIDGKVVPATHTTPGPEELHPLLKRMKQEGCTAVVMEVSSHALYQSRVAGVFFDQMGFTNLSSEHLDFHATLDEYFEAKKLLFAREWDSSKTFGGKNPEGVISQTEWGEKLLNALPESKRTKAHFLPLPSDLKFKEGMLSGTFSGIPLVSTLIGPFNAENILVAVQMAVNAGVKPGEVVSAIRKLKTVPGRLERVEDPEGRIVLVDYAHKPDALEKVLRTLRGLVQPPHKLFTVVGCGGDRDRTKRPVMAGIAENFSDHVFLTSDNPRTENPEAILDEMEKGIRSKEKVTRDSDRRRAIGTAVKASSKGDWILIAGKGHETYQLIGKETFPFDDCEVARSFLKK